MFASSKLTGNMRGSRVVTHTPVTAAVTKN